MASNPLDDRGFVASVWSTLSGTPISPRTARATVTNDADITDGAYKKLVELAKTIEQRQFHGECQQFKMAGRDLKKECRPVVLMNRHENGRNSFIVAADGNIMSFAGNRNTIEYDGLMYTLTLDQIVLNNGVRTTNLEAKGTCEYAPATPGNFDIIGCHAEAGGQPYGMTFVTARSRGPRQGPPLVTKSEETAYRKIFPRSMQGLWTSHAKDCRLFRNRGIAALKADTAIPWIQVTGDTMRGTESGRFIRSRHGGIVEMTSTDGSDFTQEVTLVGDASIEVKVAGARASAIYELCQKP